jgi:Glycosyl transferase family 2
MTLAPIVLFAYNRPEHTRRTVEALQLNPGARDSVLYAYSDGPKDGSQVAAVRNVRNYLHSIEGFKSISIVEREANRGLAASIIAGVTEVLQRYSTAIVMEDDLLSAPKYLSYMNSALDMYRPRSDIFSVTGYNYPLPIPADYQKPAYLSYRGSSWGWGTWIDRWQKVDWDLKGFPELLNDAEAQQRFACGGNDLFPMLKLQMSGKLDSWAIRFDFAHSTNEAFCLHPVHPLIRNIGFDGTGVHCSVGNDYEVSLDQDHRLLVLDPNIRLDKQILRIFNDRFCPQNNENLESKPALLQRIGRRFRRAVSMLERRP